MDNRSDFLGGHAIWEKQAKQFFEKNAAIIDRFMINPFSEESLDELMKHFKASITSQQSAFDFIPLAGTQPLSSYYSSLCSMTNEAIDLLHDKILLAAEKKTLPQTFREFYELWLECGEEVYQRWLKSDKFVSIFTDMINGMFTRT